MAEKLGPWVFGLSECPPNVTASVANKSRSVYWYTGDRPDALKYNDMGGWTHLYGHGYWVSAYANKCPVYCDTTGWPEGCVIMAPGHRNLCKANVRRLED